MNIKTISTFFMFHIYAMEIPVVSKYEYRLEGEKSKAKIKFVHGLMPDLLFHYWQRLVIRFESFGELLRDGVVPIAGEQDNGINFWNGVNNLKKISFAPADNKYLIEAI
jgi:hypothetical protein